LALYDITVFVPFLHFEMFKTTEKSFFSTKLQFLMIAIQAFWHQL